MCPLSFVSCWTNKWTEGGNGPAPSKVPTEGQQRPSLLDAGLDRPRSGPRCPRSTSGPDSFRWCLLVRVFKDVVGTGKCCWTTFGRSIFCLEVCFDSCVILSCMKIQEDPFDPSVLVHVPEAGNFFSVWSFFSRGSVSIDLSSFGGKASVCRKK